MPTSDASTFAARRIVTGPGAPVDLSVPRAQYEDIAVKKFAMLAAMLLGTGPAFAQPAAPGPAAPAQAAAPATPAPATPAPKAAPPKATSAAAAESRIEERIVQMHLRLNITPAQQPGWDAFAKVMRNNVASTTEAYQQRQASIATMSAPENMQNFAQIEQARAQGVQNLAVAFQTLYGTLSDDQKKTADAMFRHYEDRPGPHKPASK
jgi:protein CpxP